MLLLRFPILVIFGVVTCLNHDVNSQTPYKGKIVQRSVEVTTLIPPDPRVDNEMMQLLLTRLETLCVEKLENLITDTNKRFQSLENQSSEVHSIVGNIIQNNDNLESKMDNLSKDIQVLMNATKNVPSDVEAIKRNVSSLMNVTRTMANTSSNLVFKQIFYEGLQGLKDLQAAPPASCPLTFTLGRQYPKNCKEVRQSGEKVSGIYTIQPDRAPKPFKAVCDMETMGGDWTVIQRRFDGSEDFNLGWQEYKNGFGNLLGEFWLGLENMHVLTGYDANELLIELGNFVSQNRSALYSHFSIGSELEGYPLKTLGSYSGDAGESMLYNVESKFSTKDMDQDRHLYSCVAYHEGAWWHTACTNANLNGKYYHLGQVPQELVESGWSHGIFWLNDFDRPGTGLTNTRMLVRPKV